MTSEPRDQSTPEDNSPDGNQANKPPELPRKPETSDQESSPSLPDHSFFQLLQTIEKTQLNFNPMTCL